MKPLKFMKRLKVAMITHYQSSGSLYLHSLLDGHPEIITIPGVPHLDSIINGHFSSAEHALEIFNKANPKFYDTSKMTYSDQNSSGLYRLGENADEGIVTNKKLFASFFNKCLSNEKLTPKNIILSLYYSYEKSHGLELTTKKIVLFHPHEIHRTISMHYIFPDSKYLVTIRNPARAYYSRLQLMKNKAKARNIAHSHVGLLLSDANNVYELLQHNMLMRIVKIEDFAEQSQFILIKLCEFLDIDYNESLKQSTFGSKLYWGANPNYKFNKFSNTRHKKTLPLKRNELTLFSIINKRMNLITGYPSVNLSWLERRLFFLWLFLPFTEDIDWIKKSKHYSSLLDYNGVHLSRIKMMLKWLKERIILLVICIRNYRSKGYYDIIKESLIGPSSSKQ